MRHRTWTALGFTLLALFATASIARAGGIIQSLPADGSYVVFKAKSEIDFQGNLQTFERELKIASVGKGEVDGQPARWIEISTELLGRAVVGKLLIAEKYLKADENPFEHVSKAYGKGPDGAVQELPAGQLKQIMILAVGVPNFDKPKKGDKQKIKTPLGEYECQRQTGEGEADGFQNSKMKYEGELWTHDKVPFGLVKAKIKADIGIGTIETQLEAAKSGTDAKSELPDTK